MSETPLPGPAHDDADGDADLLEQLGDAERAEGEAARQAADALVMDALLRGVAEQGSGAKQRRVRALMGAVESQGSPRRTIVGRLGPAVSGMMRRVSTLGAVAGAAVVLLMLWVVWPGSQVETAEAAWQRVVQATEAAGDRRYRVMLRRRSGAELSMRLDVRGAARFVARWEGPFGRGVTLGRDGARRWLVPPIGPVVLSDGPLNPAFWQSQASLEGELLTLNLALARFQQGYRLELKRQTPSPGKMRLIAERRGDDASRPRRASLVADAETGHVRTLHIELGKRQGGERLDLVAAQFELISTDDRPRKWYQHQSHHGPQRPTVER